MAYGLPVLSSALVIGLHCNMTTLTEQSVVGTHPSGIPEQDCGVMWVQTGIGCAVMSRCGP
jgi:hypothetical protein